MSNAQWLCIIILLLSVTASCCAYLIGYQNGRRDERHRWICTRG